MYFQKIRHPSNFKFAHAHAQGTLQIGKGQVQASVRDLGEDVFHVELNDPQRWPLDARVLPMLDQAFQNTASVCQLQISGSGNLALVDSNGESMLSGLEGACLGVCGNAW